MTAHNPQPAPECYALPPQYRERATLTIEQAGEVLGISRGSAYAAVRERTLPTIKIGRRYLVPRAALEKMLSGA